MFPLPFLVKEAWPLSPLGVLLQREWDSGESPDSPVPLHFTVTDAIAEPKKIGCASLISNGFDYAIPPSVFQQDESYTSSKMMHSPSIQEAVVFTAPMHPGELPIIVTHNEYANALTIWRYAYVKGGDLPFLKPKVRQEGVQEAETDPTEKILGKVAANPHVDFWWQSLLSLPVVPSL